MDFASLMQSQIAASTSSTSSGPKKYQKRSDIEAQRQADYAQEQRDLEQQRLARLDKKRKHEEEEEERKAAREDKKQRLAEKSRLLREEEEAAEERDRRKRLGLPELVKQTEAGDGKDDGEEVVSEEQLLAKLHEMKEPRFLFGEDHTQRLRRYRKLVAQLAAPKLSTGPIPTTLELVPEAEMKVPATVPDDSAGKDLLHRQLASYFDMLLSEWKRALANRPAEVKASYTGKQALSSLEQALSNLRPLFQKLENHTLAPSILTPIVQIVHAAQQRRYVDANDGYLRLSIGKAAWPIGVTMVGIHERSAREKLHGENTEAHILSDEGTRKMLQGIKRCLSFAQVRWPPEDIGQLMG